MDTLTLARKLAGYQETEDALRAYAMFLKEEGTDSAAVLEAAVYILQFGGDYRLSYDAFLDLYRQGFFQDVILSILDGAFYAPNVEELKAKYARNCKLLKKYPYFFRTEFPDFEALPIRFYPYDDQIYIPFDTETRMFGEPLDLKEPVIRHHFFHNLENPILAEDIFSQYELTYLVDNVRKSEFIGRENHVYLHYSDWSVFCAHLPCWDLRPLLKEEKLVFLIEEEAAQYPIDFKARFGIDYSRYPLKPVGIREIHRLIWHAQLSAHNGGDFFNEVFDEHPNLLTLPSLMLSDFENVIHTMRKALEHSKTQKEAVERFALLGNRSVVEELYRMKSPTDKDLLVGSYLVDDRAKIGLDPASRIAPAVFFQPHIEALCYQEELDGEGRAVLYSEACERLRNMPALRDFRYIKTFVPLRRFTNSCAATVRFMDLTTRHTRPDGLIAGVEDAPIRWILNRSFMADPSDRMYRDSVVVRFEDGKLNPKATFSALAAFLDLPYTQSMTYCSAFGVRDPHPETKGFDPSAVYRTYDAYIGEAERCCIEYFLRDAYAYYGYDFQYYDGQPMDEARLRALIPAFTTINQHIRTATQRIIKDDLEKGERACLPGENEGLATERILEAEMREIDRRRFQILKSLLDKPAYVNRSGQPLRIIPRLTPDPVLLEAPLYH